MARRASHKSAARSGYVTEFRRTCATLMLEGGADVRFIQQQLGHAELSTTQIYTQVSIHMLKEVHTRTHPGASLSREAAAELAAELADEAEEDDEGGLVEEREEGKVQA